MHAMLTAVLEGAHDPAITDVDVVAKAALHATEVDVLDADGYVLGTPANLGYVSGALKHFFDTIYYPCLEDTVGRPFGVFVHGGSDTTGALKAIDVITTGLRWRRAQEPVVVTGGPPSSADLDACRELGGALAAGLSF